MRYRGYVYDRETELYYLQSRYYNPEWGRFINADNYPSTGQGLLGNNMFAYCGNNPVMREDEGGELWGTVAKFALGVLSQYIGDVLENVASGASGWDIFTPTSSVGEYLAAGVTALIPGSDLGAAIIRSTVSESIKGVERYILGEDLNLGQMVCNVIVGTAVDTTLSKLSDFVSDRIIASKPKNYSSYAGVQRKKNPTINQEDIYRKMHRASGVNRAINVTAGFSFSVINSLIAP